MNGLWVRSQDKQCLIKTEKFSRFGKTIRANVIDLQTGDFWELGEYETKERCLEILDEIQELLVGGKTIITGLDEDAFEKITLEDIKKAGLLFLPNDVKVELLNQGNIVYQMPEN